MKVDGVFDRTEFIESLEGLTLVLGGNASGKTVLSKKLLMGSKMRRYSKDYISLLKSNHYFYLSIEQYKRIRYEQLSEYIRANKSWKTLMAIRGAYSGYMGSNAFTHSKIKSIDTEEVVKEFLKAVSSNKFKAPISIPHSDYLTTNYHSRHVAYLSGLNNSLIQEEVDMFMEQNEIEGTVIVEPANKTSETISYGEILEKIIISNHKSKFKWFVDNKIGVFANEIRKVPFLSDEELDVINSSLKKYSWFRGKLEQTPTRKLLKYTVDKSNVTLDWFTNLSEGEKNILSLEFFKLSDDNVDVDIWDDPFDSYDNVNKSNVMREIIKSRAKRQIIFTHKIEILNFLKCYRNPKKVYILIDGEIVLLDIKNLSENKILRGIDSRLFDQNKLACSLLLRRIFENRGNEQGVALVNSFMYKGLNENLILSFWNSESTKKDTGKISALILGLFSKIARLKVTFDKVFVELNLEEKKYDYLLNLDDSEFSDYQKNIISLYLSSKFLVDDFSHSNQWTSSIIEIIMYKKRIEEIDDELTKYILLDL